MDIAGGVSDVAKEDRYREYHRIQYLGESPKESSGLGR